jgi:GNAT superfamily N-acetyltransferase
VTEGETFSRLFSHDIAIDVTRLKFEPFKTDTAQVRDFDCGELALNDFLCSREVYNYQEEKWGKTTLVFYDGELIAYYTLSYSSLRTSYLDDHYKGFSKLNEYKLQEIPAIAIGRLATKNVWQNRGVGRAIVTKIIDDALDGCDQSAGLRLLLVQAKHGAVPFYEKLGFQLVKPTRKERVKREKYGTSTMYLDLASL